MLKLCAQKSQNIAVQCDKNRNSHITIKANDAFYGKLEGFPEISVDYFFGSS